MLLRPVHYVLAKGRGRGRCRIAYVWAWGVDVASLDVELDFLIDEGAEGTDEMLPMMAVLADVPHGSEPGTWHFIDACQRGEFGLLVDGIVPKRRAP